MFYDQAITSITFYTGVPAGTTAIPAALAPALPVPLVATSGGSAVWAQPPTPEWGIMLSDGRETLNRAWWVSLFPGLAILVTTLSINFVGDGLRSALDPRVRGR